MPDRLIIHVDMDAFFASIEVLDHPELRGKPLVVGGGVSRGVVSAASYEARRFGIHSAMPMGQALRLCPHVIVMPVRMERYHGISREIMALLAVRTPLLEQVSVDEAYLDLTGWLPAGSSAEAAAREMQSEIYAATGLTCSLGVAAGKAIAKMASDLRKPNGLVVVPPGTEAAFLAPLPIGKLRGVGAATERKLREIGISTIGELARLPGELLTSKFGVHGRDLHALALGLDDSPVVPERQAKSIGRETTFLLDITERNTLERTLLELSEDVSQSLRRYGLLARGVTLKLRYDDFHTISRARTLTAPSELTDPLYQTALALLRAANPTRPVRLIGVTASPLLRTADRQDSLFSAAKVDKERKLASAVDTIRDRFGESAITRARLVEGKKDEEG